MLLHDPAAELHRRRYLSLLLGEVARQDGEALDLLHANALAVDLVDDLLDEVLRIAAGGGHLGLVERDERGDVRTPVADRNGLRDEARRLERVLEVLRRDVLPARRDDQILLAVGDLQPAVRVELADVAGAEPAVLRERGGGRIGVLEVPGEDGVAADEDLAVLVDLDLAAVDRPPDGPELEIVRVVRAQRARRLREPVTLD